MPTLNLDSRIVRNPDLIATEMDGETVMMSIERGEYFGLNRVGSRIWELLATPMTIQQLCEQLQQEFEIDAGRCRTEVLDFADDMLAQGLLQEAPS